MSHTAARERAAEGRPPATYRLNREAWVALWAKTQVSTDSSPAAEMGVDQGAITRIVRATNWQTRRVNLDFAVRAVVALRRLTGDQNIGLDDLIEIHERRA